MSKRTGDSGGLINLAKAIKLVRKKHPWWPEVSIRKAVSEGHIPHMKASLSARAKYFVRLKDLEDYVEKLKVDSVTDASNMEAMKHE